MIVENMNHIANTTEQQSPTADEEERGRRLAEALCKLQELRPFDDIPDPVAWQREIRRDRPLPGRED
jgi:hypothetical protein